MNEIKSSTNDYCVVDVLTKKKYFQTFIMSSMKMASEALFSSLCT